MVNQLTCIFIIYEFMMQTQKQEKKDQKYECRLIHYVMVNEYKN